MFKLLARTDDSDEKDALFAAANTPERRRAEAWFNSRLASGKKSFGVEVARITPALAELMLTKNEKNRKIRPSRVAKYVRILREGRWLLQLHGISFAPDGILNNGQHRLMAIIESGVPADVVVAFGETPQAKAVVDTQGTRTGADTLGIENFAHSAIQAASIRMLRYIESDFRIKSVDNDEVLDLAGKYEGLEESAAIGSSIFRAVKVAPTAFAVAHYLITREHGDDARVTQFFQGLRDGLNIKAKTDPIAVMRRKFITTQVGMAGGLHYKVVLIAELIIAWNLWAAGRRRTAIKWDSTQPFPKVE